MKLMNMGLTLLHETDIPPAGAVPKSHTKVTNTISLHERFI